MNLPLDITALTQLTDDPQTANPQTDSDAHGHDYLTYKLDLIKTLAVKSADPLYHKASGLRVKELRLLRLIHDYPDITSSELKVKLVLDKTLLSKHLADLEQRGLIEKTPDTADNRVYRLNLTKDGLATWKTCEKIGCDLERQMFAEISDDDWQQLHGLLDKILLSLTHWQQLPKSAKITKT